MSIDGCEQFSTAISLTRQRDGVALSRTLLTTLDRQIACARVSLMEVLGHRKLDAQAGTERQHQVSIRRFDDCGERQAGSTADAGFHQAISTLLPCSVPVDGAERLVIPISGEIGPLRLVVLDQMPADPTLRTKALQIVEIYGNLVRLMDSRERDALTGLLNRQTFATLFELANQRANQDATRGLILGVIDIDHFKRVNDTYGHLFGDEVLIHLARLMERSFRYTDDLLRFGGEEFIVLLNTDRGNVADKILDRFRKVVEDHHFPGLEQITVSIGFVHCLPGLLPTTLVDQADRALYQAKQQGRNRVVDFAAIDQQPVGEIGGIDLF